MVSSGREKNASFLLKRGVVYSEASLDSQRVHANILKGHSQSQLHTSEPSGDGCEQVVKRCHYSIRVTDISATNFISNRNLCSHEKLLP
jgi:hypothetical protein